jgi:hypothetical protein
MTTLSMRMIKGDFVVTGPDVEPMKFKSRREAREWCMAHHPGSPIEEIGTSHATAAKTLPAVSHSQRGDSLLGPNLTTGARRSRPRNVNCPLRRNLMPG